MLRNMWFGVVSLDDLGWEWFTFVFMFVMLVTPLRCHDSRRFRSGFEEVAALRFENQNQLLHLSSFWCFKNRHSKPLNSLSFAMLLGTAKPCHA